MPGNSVGIPCSILLFLASSSPEIVVSEILGCWFSLSLSSSVFSQLVGVSELARLLGKSESKTQKMFHWGRDKMATISQTTFSNAFSWMKMYKFRLIFHWLRNRLRNSILLNNKSFKYHADFGVKDLPRGPFYLRFHKESHDDFTITISFNSYPNSNTVHPYPFSD